MSELTTEQLTPLSRVLDQPSATSTLATFVTRTDAQIPPMLFHGPEGVGKRTTALAFAASLVCLQRDGVDACGNCSACQRIRDAHYVTAMREGSATHDTPRQYPDAGLISIPSGKTRVSILQARDLSLSLTQKPFELPRRIYIVDPADSMTSSAANALLKVLEEPPVTAVLILISAAPWSLPITVRSRLTMIRFRALSAGSIAKLLIEDGTEPNEARERAQLANGSFSRALHVDPAAEAQQLQLWCEALNRVARGESVAPIAVALSEAAGRDATQARAAIERLLAVLRDVAAVAHGLPPLTLPQDTVEPLARRSELLLGATGDRFMTVEQLRSELIVFHRNPRLAIEGAVLAVAGKYLP
jgi:DNA polymerase-3 subunit delta'